MLGKLFNWHKMLRIELIIAYKFMSDNSFPLTEIFYTHIVCLQIVSIIINQKFILTLHMYITVIISYRYEYKMAREYNWNVKNKASKGYEENYFMVFRDGCVYYNELETR